MVRLKDLPTEEAKFLAEMPCPQYDSTPWTDGPPLNERRVAIVSTAGLQRRGDRPFTVGSADYRVIPEDAAASDLMMSHISTNFDRSGFEQDVNVMLPLERLHELAEAGEIGSVAKFHYSFMGATDPAAMEDTARHLASLLKADNVDACILIPV